LLTGSESAAADVVQEAFIGLLEASDGFDSARGSLATRRRERR
jgi:DNA-directed RNA polymerase specialized sigma24 family protein